MSTKPWVAYNPLTQTYDTKDGTRVAAELVDNVTCLVDVVRIATIRENQRAAIVKPQETRNDNDR